MQVYAIRLCNFMRFGGTNNSVVFDLSPAQKTLVERGELTMDAIYDDFASNPSLRVAEAKARGLEQLIGIAGIIDGDESKSNGSGKSTVLEAICYAHYGSIVRLSANTDKTGDPGNRIITRINHIIPETVKESWVEEYCESNGCLYRIKRGRKLGKNEKTTPIVECEQIGVESTSGRLVSGNEAAIDAINDMSYDLFVNSQMFGQSDAGKFLVGTDKIRKDMIIDLLRMREYISKRLERVRSKKRFYETKLSSLQDINNAAEVQLLAIYNKYAKQPLTVFTDVKTGEVDISVSELIEDKNIAVQNNNDAIKKIDALIVATSLAVVQANIISLQAQRQDAQSNWNSVQTRERQEQEDILDRVAKYRKQISDGQTEERALAGRKKQAEQTVAAAAKTIIAMEAEVESCNKAIAKAAMARNAKPQYVALKESLNAQIVGVQKEISSMETVLRLNTVKVDKLRTQIARAKSTKSLECSECGSLVNLQHVNDKIDGLLAENRQQQPALDALNKSLSEVQASLNDTNNKLGKIDTFLLCETSATSALQDLEFRKKNQIALQEQVDDLGKRQAIALAAWTELSTLEKIDGDKFKEIAERYVVEKTALSSKIEELNKAIDTQQVVLNNIEAKVKSHQADKNRMVLANSKLAEEVGGLRQEKATLHELYKQINERTNDIKHHTTMLTAYKGMEEIYGLDGFQTRVVRRHLPTLNAYTQEALDVMSNGDLQVELDINDKSEIEIKITGGSADTYEMISGGEKMIIRLAVDVGLSRLAFIKTVKLPEMIALDEVFAVLDKSNVNVVFSLLHYLQDKFKRILLIAHNPEINSALPATLVVEKNGGINGLSSIRKMMYNTI